MTEQSAQPENDPPPQSGHHLPQRVLPKEAYTPWAHRMLASLIDWTPMWVLVFAPYIVEAIVNGWGCAVESFAGSGFCSGTPSVLTAITGFGSLLLIGVYFFWNFCHRQGKTGQSIGKSVLKFKVISEKTWQPIGFWRSLLRQIAHYVDQLICYIGYLFPLWDDKRQTLGDKIMSTVCVPLDTPEPPPWSSG